MFVDCLWRLHRCVRALFARLRFCSRLPALLARRASSAHFSFARQALTRQALGCNGHWSVDALDRSVVCSPSGAVSRAASRSLGGASPDCSEPALDQRLLSTAPLALSLATARVGAAVQEISQGWEAIGRCLSKMAAGGAGPSELSPSPSEGGDAALELLEGLQRLCGSLSERLVPAVDQIAAATQPPSASSSSVLRSGANEAGGADGSAPRLSGGTAVGPASAYLNQLAARLQQSPGSISFEEAQKTQLLARELTTVRSQLSGDVREQMQLLQAAVGEKIAVTEELGKLQDSHAVMRLNFDYLQKCSSVGKQRSGGASPTTSQDLAMDSRQRSLLDGRSLATHEGTSLRRHGYFVDVLTLSSSESALASGPPQLDAPAAWELPVRKVYEQHARNLQAQARVADGKSVDIAGAEQSSQDQLSKQQEESQQLRADIAALDTQAEKLNEDIQSTHKNYNAQLAMLTEHVCVLSTRMTDKEERLAAVKSQKFHCGRCGTWNQIIKLMGDGKGACSTCKEKVLGVA